MIEKVRSYDARTQDQMTNIYEEFKLSNGFGVDEISNKKNSLKGVLEPFSSNANLAMLKELDLKTFLLLPNLLFEFFP